MVIAQGWLWPQWAVRNYVRTFPRPLGNTEVLPRWTELFDFGFGMCCLCNAVAFCCLLLDCNPGSLETTVRAVFIFDVLMEVGLSLQKQSLQPPKGVPGLISLDDDVQLWQIVLWHLFCWKEGDVCVCVHTCVGKGSGTLRVLQRPEFSSGSASSSWHHCTCLQLSLSFPDAFDHWHCFILVQHLCKIRNLEEHLISVKGF